MKKLLSVSIISAAALLSVPALAADYGGVPGMVNQTAPVNFPQNGDDWTGFYAGIIGGYVGGSASHTSDLDGFLPDDMVVPIDFGNAAIGGTATYLHQLGDDGLVLGLQGNVLYQNNCGSGADSLELIAGSPPLTLDANGVTCAGWAGEVQGLVGFDAGQFMPHLIAGIGIEQTSWSGTGSVNYGPLGLDLATYEGNGTNTYGILGAGVAFKPSDNTMVTFQGAWNPTLNGAAVSYLDTTPIGGGPTDVPVAHNNLNRFSFMASAQVQIH